METLNNFEKKTKHVIKQTPEGENRKKLLIISGLFVLIVIVAVLSGVGEKETIIPSEKTITISSKESKIGKEMKVRETITTPSKVEFKVGEEINVDNFSVIINSVKVTLEWVHNKESGFAGETYYYVAKPKKGYKFVLIEHTTKNNGKEEDSLIWQNIKLETTEGYMYESSVFGPYHGESTTQNLENEYRPSTPIGYTTLLPRESKHGWEGFEIPQDLEPVRLLIYKDWDEEPDIIINLQERGE